MMLVTAQADLPFHPLLCSGLRKPPHITFSPLLGML